MFYRLRTPTHRISSVISSPRSSCSEVVRHYLHSVYRITSLFFLGLLFVDGRSKHRARRQSLERGLGRQPSSDIGQNKRGRVQHRDRAYLSFPGPRDDGIYVPHLVDVSGRAHGVHPKVEHEKQ